MKLAKGKSHGNGSTSNWADPPTPPTAASVWGQKELSANISNSSVRLGVKGAGLDVDVEELLGLNTTTSSFAIDGYWRFMKRRRHRLDFSWLSFHRSGEAILGRDIEFNDLDIKAGSHVNTTFDLDMYRVGYSYSFFQDDRMDLGVGLGVYILPVSFEITASGLVNGSESESITAPLPVLSLRADFAITPRWLLLTKFDVFYLEISNFRGAIFDTRVAVEYNPFKNVGFGLSLNSFNLKVEAEGDDYPEI
ncbi:MAG: hypothetical protein JRI74_11740, partial [Deltaproteobacteria bacterium]|nr:hypothetical protein [Deltaproteobacteria bacterium]